MRNVRSVVAAGMTVLLAAGTMLATASSAHAKNDPEAGTCSKSSTWKGGLDRGAGTASVTFTVLASKPGVWSYTLKQNGAVFITGTDQTEPRPVGNGYRVRWAASWPDKDKRLDTFSVRAVNTRTGEVCKATFQG